LARDALVARRPCQPDDEGGYSFPDLPPGNYTLKVWHPDLGDRSMAVTVGDGVTDLDVTL